MAEPLFTHATNFPVDLCLFLALCACSVKLALDLVALYRRETAAAGAGGAQALPAAVAAAAAAAAPPLFPWLPMLRFSLAFLHPHLEPYFLALLGLSLCMLGIITLTLWSALLHV